MKQSFFCAILFLVACKATSQVPDGNTGGGNTYVKDDKNKREVEADCGMDLEDDGTDGLIYHVKSRQPFSGVCRSYFEDGRLEREAHFRDGLIDGEYLKLYEFDKEKNNQVIESRTNYKMGVEHGKWEYFYPSGQRAWEHYYNEGKKHGTFLWFTEDGKKKKEENWKDNLKNGACKEYYVGEKPKEEINYKDGVMEGKFITWFENGQVSYEGTFKQGKEEGEVVTFYKNSQMQTQRFFKAGVPEGEWKTWYEDGKEKSVEHYVKGIRQGEFKYFFSDGQLKRLENYVDGKIMSFEDYDEFGNRLDPEEMKNEKEDE